MIEAFVGATVFDGTSLQPNAVLLVEEGRVAGLAARVPQGAHLTTLSGGILAPGFLDLQVHGGGGELVGATPAAEHPRTVLEHQSHEEVDHAGGVADVEAETHLVALR